MKSMKNGKGLPPCFRCRWQPCRCKDGITLYHGDSREILPFLQQAVDSIITDPPYGIVNRFGSIRTKGKHNGTRLLQFPWDGPERAPIIVAILSLAFARCKQSASCFVFVGFDTAERYAACARAAGFTVKPAAWMKKCPPPAGKGNWWPSAFELAFYGYRNSPWFGDIDPRRRNVWVADSYRWRTPGKIGHPTQKPLAIVRNHVAALVPPGGVCLDPFAGSGTTLEAAKLEARRAIGIEIEEQYCRMATQRLCDSPSIVNSGGPNGQNQASSSLQPGGPIHAAR
jgi:site-specific DNA-methyltransferase (adenine-specific)